MPKRIPKSSSPRVDVMCGPGTEEDELEDLRFRRDLAARDGDMQTAMACAIAIDKKKRGDSSHNTAAS